MIGQRVKLMEWVNHQVAGRSINASGSSALRANGSVGITVFQRLTTTENLSSGRILVAI